jgi:ABC-2 type transport system permease protein
MLERIKHMLLKEFIQVLRDPKMRGIIFVMPVLQVLVFGYAVTLDVENVATAVYDLDNSVASREVVARFAGSGYFDVVEHVGSAQRARELLDRGRVSAVLQINQGFGDTLRTARTAQLQLLVDGTDSNTAGVVLDYSAEITRELSQTVLITRFTRVRGSFERPGRVEMETRAWFNDNLESRNFYVPGVIAIVVMLITLMLTSMAVVREKEIGTIEQIMVAPITPAEFILGKTLPFALIGFADVVLVTVVGVFWFGVPIHGSLALLFSTVSRTQQQAMMSAFFFYFPAVLLSGFMFPIANMPEVIQWLTYLNPLRYFLIVVRGIFLKGVGPEILWPEMLALAVLGIALLWLAASRFQKTLA